jgi:hypothetical protein
MKTMKKITMDVQNLNGKQWLCLRNDGDQIDVIRFKHSRLADAIESLHHTVEKGYPAAHLCNRLGILNLILEKSLEAHQTFKKATQTPLVFKDSEQLFEQSQLPVPSIRKGAP